MERRQFTREPNGENFAMLAHPSWESHGGFASPRNSRLCLAKALRS